MYLLDLFCNATKPEVREKTAELLAKMLSDKLVGPKVRILLNKFLPPIFMDAMRDNPEASVHMFEGKQAIGEFGPSFKSSWVTWKKAFGSQSMF